MMAEVLEIVGEELEEVSLQHGFIGIRAARYLGAYVDEQGLGYVCGADTEFGIPGLGTKTKKPDVAFVSLEKMPEISDEPVVPFAPDLAIEVISRTDDWSAIVAEVNLYLAAGTLLVWVVDPYTKSVFVFEKGQEFVTLHGNMLLDGKAVVTGFQLAVSKLFELPKRPAN